MEQERNRRAGAVKAVLVLLESSVYGVYFMVKLLRACVRMPWRDQAMKDAASGETLRGGASNL
jgi:hypothetical protein